MNSVDFKDWVLGKDLNDPFSGCDGGDPGSERSPSTWLFGLEWGDPKSVNARAVSECSNADVNYSIETQIRRWPFNRNAFKLLSSIYAGDINSYREFAHREQPFVKGQKGYFKGNLYPLGFNNLSAWNDEAIALSGFLTKEDYIEWARRERLSVVRCWIQKYKPKLFIGAGIGFLHDFLNALGTKSYTEHRFEANNIRRRIFLGSVGETVFAIVPHLSGGRFGLTSTDSISLAGHIIRERLLHNS